jgi:predicted deacetylase
MTSRALVVSIHDVSPLTREPVTKILATLAAIGIPRVSLLVVPDHHHRGNITQDPGFRTWLRGQISAGHEPVLHGYHHQRQRQPGESARTQFFTRHYTAGEGEFYDIAQEPARDLMTRGRIELEEAAGIPPAGFIAPAWLLSPAAESAARALGFQYTSRLKTVTDLTKSGRTIPSQSLCWSVRSPWRRTLSLAWNALLFRALATHNLLRISIHPPDIVYPKIWRQILTLSTTAARTRRPLTYAQFIST